MKSNLDMNILLGKLKEWVKVVQTALLVTTGIEAILVIIIGIASNKLGKSFDVWFGILIGCSIFYIFLLVVKAAYQIKFPGSIIDELIAKRQLEEKNKLFDRQKAINGFITTAIQSLNQQTCTIIFAGEGDQLCAEELALRVRGLLTPITNYTGVLLDIRNEKNFTAGLFLHQYYKLPDHYEDIAINKSEEGALLIENVQMIMDRGILILKDDLNLRTLLQKDLIDAEVGGPQYEIQTAIKRTLNNSSFNRNTFEFENKPYSIICSSIPEVCSDLANGVLFIIGDSDIIIPDDLEEVLNIFNRLTANFVSKYDSCLFEQIILKKSQLVQKTLLNSPVQEVP